MKPRNRIYKTTSDLKSDDIQEIYRKFNSPILELDCGKKCAPHNPGGKPFCCDICHAVPAAYKSEWAYLRKNTALWHVWRSQECADGSVEEQGQMRADTPAGMVLLACLGPDKCERDFRSLSCRQFPFFPYVTSDYRFLGIACEWEFENMCWVISNLARVTQSFRREMVETFDSLFALFQSEFENYTYHSEKLRAEYVRRKRRFPLLHRNGSMYLVSPASERIQKIDLDRLPKFHPYKSIHQP